MYILQTKLNIYEINSKKLHEHLILISFYNTYQYSELLILISDIFYFIPYIITTSFIIYVILCKHTPNLSSCVNTNKKQEQI